LTHSIEGEEPWPEDIVEVDVTSHENPENEADDPPGDGTPTVEWDMTKKDDEDQMTLF